MAEFQEFDLLEPFGSWRDNWHAAIVANILATVYTDPKHNRPSVADFMYKDPFTREAEQIAAADTFFFQSKKAVNHD